MKTKYGLQELANQLKNKLPDLIKACAAASTEVAMVDSMHMDRQLEKGKAAKAAATPKEPTKKQLTKKAKIA